MSLIDRLRRSYVDHGTNYVQEAADALERLAREKHEAQDCFDAAKDEIENLLAEEKMQLEQIVNQGLEIERLNKEVNNQRDEILAGDQDIERLTAELARARQYHATELADVVAERDSLKSAVLGSKALIAELQSEIDYAIGLQRAIEAHYREDVAPDGQANQGEQP